MKSKFLMLAFLSVKPSIQMRAYPASFTIAIVVIISATILGASLLIVNHGGRQQVVNAPLRKITTLESTMSVVTSLLESTVTNSSSDSCQSCVQISTVYLEVESQGMDSSCWNQGTTVLTQNLGLVLGPNSPTNTFSYSFSFMGNTMNDMQGVGNCDAGPTIEGFLISPSNSQLTISSVLPSLPVTVSPGNQMQFTLYLAALQTGYSGPIIVLMQLA